MHSLMQASPTRLAWIYGVIMTRRTTAPECCCRLVLAAMVYAFLISRD